MSLSIFPRARNRWLAHLGLAVLTVLWCYASYLILLDSYETVRVIAIATGYIALVFLAATLMIGPLQLIMQKQKRSPVNINLRRDIGIWAGLTGLAHVIYGFQAHLQGRIVLFFFEETAAGYQPLRNLFGASNYLAPRRQSSCWLCCCCRATSPCAG
jgi:sulfoxide reductase heme-binding subunit YedZ